MERVVADDEEIALSRPMRRAWLSSGERSTVYRCGQVVVRETGPWAAMVRSLLRHLENVGFAGSPRVVGSGFDPDCRETLSYIEGEFMHPGQRSMEGAAAVGQLLRELHEATASPTPRPYGDWPGEPAPPHSPERTVVTYSSEVQQPCQPNAPKIGTRLELTFRLSNEVYRNRSSESDSQAEPNKGVRLPIR